MSPIPTTTIGLMPKRFTALAAAVVLALLAAISGGAAEVVRPSKDEKPRR